LNGFGSVVTTFSQPAPGRTATIAFKTVGDSVRHIFSAEKRYIERLSNPSLTDPASITKGGVEALFQFGQQSRADLKEFVNAFPSQDWDAPSGIPSNEQPSERHAKEDCCPRSYARNSSLGTDCHHAPLQRLNR
jgi:hypothetical protein